MPFYRSLDLLPLELWRTTLSTSFDDISFVVCSTTHSESPMYLVCSPNTLHNHPPAGFIPRARIILSQYGEFTFQVLRTKDKGTVTSEDELRRLCSMITKSSGYKFCPGLSNTDKYASIFGYDSKSVRLMSEPFYRVDSPRCELWHKLANNSSILEKDMEEVLCQPCKRMLSHLDQRVRSSTVLSPIDKVARLDPSSGCAFSR